MGGRQIPARAERATSSLHPTAYEGPEGVERTGTSPAGSEDSPTPKVQVSLGRDVQEHMAAVCARKGISLAEFGRRAIGMLLFIEEEQAKGAQLYLGRDGEPQVRLVIYP